jgi:hypothetical protein
LLIDIKVSKSIDKQCSKVGAYEIAMKNNAKHYFLNRIYFVHAEIPSPVPLDKK